MQGHGNQQSSQNTMNTSNLNQQSGIVPTNRTNQFNQNQFLVAVASCYNIKFIEMETYLTSKALNDDSTTSLEELKANVCRCVNYGFLTQLNILPGFYSLNKHTSFQHLFLNGLHSTTFDTCKAIFDHIGDIIKSFLCSEKTIKQEKCPEAYIIVQVHQFIDGWLLLETLLKSRLAICAATLQVNLDQKQCDMHLDDQESLQEFFIKVQGLQNGYFYNSTNDRFVPVVKIMKMYLDELSRYSAYYPNIIKFQKDLSYHIEQYSIEGNVVPLPFTLSDVYTSLVRMRVPQVPHSLSPLEDTTNSFKTKKNHPSFEALISSLESTICVDCTTPEICSEVANRHRCQVCLIGYHDELDCHARGPEFQHLNLRRQVKIYNQIYGNTPLKGHKQKEWNPPSIPPIHKDKENDKPKSILKSNKKNNKFKNYNTKTNEKEIQMFESEKEIEEEVEKHEEEEKEGYDLSMLSFINNQEEYNIDEIDCLDSPYDTSVTNSFVLPLVQPVHSQREPGCEPTNHSELALQVKSVIVTMPCTLTALTSKISSTRSHPSKHFIQYQAASSQRNFSKFCDVTMMVDGGANCGSLKYKELFTFYVSTPSSVQIVAGSGIKSEGWGGISVNMNGKVILADPFYHYPNNPSNIWSPNVLKIFCNFKHVFTVTNEFVHYIDQDGQTFTEPSTVYNDLDFTNLGIYMFSLTPNPTIAIMEAPLQ